MTLAPLSYFLTMFVVAGLALWLTDLEIMPAFILGAIAGSTSEAIVIPLVRQLKMREENETLLSVESSVNDVLSIVITVALVEAYKLGEFKIAAISSDLVASFLVAIVVGQGLFLGDARVLVYGALLWIAFHIFVLAYEEPTLRSSFGMEYDTYCANVSRWLPRLPGPTPPK